MTLDLKINRGEYLNIRKKKQDIFKICQPYDSRVVSIQASSTVGGSQRFDSYTGVLFNMGTVEEGKGYFICGYLRGDYSHLPMFISLANKHIVSISRTKLPKGKTLEAREAIDSLVKNQMKLKSYKTLKNELSVLKPEDTGIYISNIPLFKHLVLSHEIYTKLLMAYGDMILFINDLKNYAKANNIDFVSVNFKEISFEGVHVTTEENFEKMRENITYEKDYIGDLGSGFYGALTSEKGLENLDNYCSQKFNSEEYVDEDLVKLSFNYKGNLNLCLVGEGHEDYIVLKELSKIRISNIEEYELEENYYI